MVKTVTKITLDEEELEWQNAETIFNADRDNNGQLIKVKDFIKILEAMKSDGQNTKISRQISASRAQCA